jgi:hypothetical protein
MLKDNLKVGKPQVKPDTPSHTKGVREGNTKGAYKKQKGHKQDGTSSAKRSTGVSPKKHEPILPIMPNLSPG